MKTPTLAWLLLAPIVSVAVVAGVAAQSTTSSAVPSTRTASGESPKATGVIRGRVLAADTGRPLRRAQIVLTAPGVERRTANTGLDGRYELRELTPARYTLSVSRSGYLSMQYGQQHELEPPRPLQLSDAQTMEGVDFTLSRAASIAGRVVDDVGEPIAGVTVWAMRPMFAEGRRQLVLASPNAFQASDDTGAFRITGLPPGTYYVRASSRETWMATVAGVRTPLAFAPTFFPGTAAAGEAQLIDVAAGQQIRDLDLALLASRAATLSGVAVDSRGLPLSGRSIGLTYRFLSAGGSGMMSIGSVQAAADGAFVLKNVPPGEYDLTASTGNPGSGDGEVASMRVVVNGVDLDNLRLVTTGGWSVSGRVLTENGEPPVFASGRAVVRVVSLVAVPMSGVGLGNGEVKDDGTFDIRGIVGPSRIVASVPDGWMVKSIRVNDRDVTGLLLDLGSRELMTGVEVIVSTRITRVSGQITDARGAPLRGGTVIVFPQDAEKWGAQSPNVAVARPDQQGRYEVRGLPAGDYYAVALEFVENGMWNDPEYLDGLRRDARPFTLDEGAALALPLRVG